MKVDLHSHTEKSGDPHDHILSELFQIRDCYSKAKDVFHWAIREKGLDAFAITDHENIENALKLHSQHPDKVIVGSEYAVRTDEGYWLHVVSLGLTEEIHGQLLDLKDKGLERFTDFLKEKQIPYYLAHIARRFKSMSDPEKVIESALIERWLRHFYALETKNSLLSEEENLFAKGLARFYGLAEVGGSDSHEISSFGITYTVSDKAKNIEEFLQEFRKGNIYAQGEDLIPDRLEIVAKNITKDFLRDQLVPFMDRLTKNGILAYIKEANPKNIVREALIIPVLFISYLGGMKAEINRYLESKRQNALELRESYKNYLLNKILQNPNSQPLSQKEKLDLLYQEMRWIYDSFYLDRALPQGIRQDDRLTPLKRPPQEPIFWKPKDWLEAGRRIKGDWLDMLSALDAYVSKPNPENAQRKIKIPFTKVLIDAKSLYLLLDTFDLPPLLTVITHGEKIVKAFLDVPLNRVYGRLKDIAIPEEVNHFSQFEERIEAIREIAEKQTKSRVGMIKLAKKEFFESLLDVIEIPPFAYNLRALTDLFAKSSSALRAGLLKFYEVKDGRVYFHKKPSIEYVLELASKLDIKSDTIQTLIEEMIPNGKYGLALKVKDGYIGLLLEKDEEDLEITFPSRSTIDDLSTICHKKSAVINYGLRTMDYEHYLRNFARILRKEFDLDSVFGMDIEKVKDFQNFNIEDFLMGYGTNYVFISRSEIMDRLMSKGYMLKEALPFIKENFKAANLNRESLTYLIKTYLNNASNYLKNKEILLEVTFDKTFMSHNPLPPPFRKGGQEGFSGENKKLFIIGKKGIKEDTIDEITPGEKISLNINSLRRIRDLAETFNPSKLADYLKPLFPQAMLRKMEYKTGLASINLRDRKGRPQKLYLLGGPHIVLNNAWLGDAFLVLLDPITKEVKFKEEFPNSPLLYLTKEGKIELELPRDTKIQFLSPPSPSLYKGGCLIFIPHAYVGGEKGLTNFIGESSPLKDFIPGLYSKMTLACLTNGERLTIGEEEYRIESGWLSLEEAYGKMFIPPKDILRWIGIGWTYNSFLFSEEDYAATGAITVGHSMAMDEPPLWWDNLIRATIDGALEVEDHNGQIRTRQYNSNESFIPVSKGRFKLDKRERAFIRDQHGGKALTYQIISAIAIPFDERGNYIIRARATAKEKNHEGFGLVEIFLNLKELLGEKFVPDEIFSPIIEKKGHTIVFSHQGRTLIEIELNGSDYLDVLKKQRKIFAFLRRPLAGFVSAGRRPLYNLNHSQQIASKGEKAQGSKGAEGHGRNGAEEKGGKEMIFPLLPCSSTPRKPLKAVEEIRRLEKKLAESGRPNYLEANWLSSLDTPKYLITGSNGFIARHMIDLLLKMNEQGKNFTIIATDRGVERPPYLNQNRYSSVIYQPADLTKLGEVRNLLGLKPEVIIHFAGRFSYTAPWKQLKRDNVEAVKILFGMAKENGVKRIINIGSASIYAGSDTPITENHPINPKDKYAQSKLRGELEAFKYYAPEEGMEVYSLRPGIVGGYGVGLIIDLFYRGILIGPPQKKDLIFSPISPQNLVIGAYLLSLMDLSNLTVRTFNDTAFNIGEEAVNVEAMFRLMGQRLSRHYLLGVKTPIAEIFGFGYQEEIRIPDNLMTFLAELSEICTKVLNYLGYEEKEPIIPKDSIHYLQNSYPLDCQKLERYLGWEPASRSLHAIVSEALEYYEKVNGERGRERVHFAYFPMGEVEKADPLKERTIETISGAKRLIQAYQSYEKGEMDTEKIKAPLLNFSIDKKSLYLLMERIKEEHLILRAEVLSNALESVAHGFNKLLLGWPREWLELLRYEIHYDGLLGFLSKIKDLSWERILSTLLTAKIAHILKEISVRWEALNEIMEFLPKAKYGFLAETGKDDIGVEIIKDGRRTLVHFPRKAVDGVHNHGSLEERMEGFRRREGLDLVVGFSLDQLLEDLKAKGILKKIMTKLGKEYVTIPTIKNVEDFQRSLFNPEINLFLFYEENRIKFGIKIMDERMEKIPNEEINYYNEVLVLMGKESIKRVEEQIKGKVRLKVMDISELKEDIKDMLFPGIWTRIYGLASKMMG